MGVWDKIRGEFIDIVEWLDDGSGALAVRFERHQNEIKNGAQLVVRPGQSAVFVREGRLADVFGPGQYRLETQNLPILSTLLGWKHGFESPFKAEVIFVRTTRVTDLRWGTQNPVLLRDEDLGAVRLRAFGTYSSVVRDAARFVQALVGTDEQLHMDELHEALRNHIVARFSDLVAERELPLLDLAAQADELGSALEQRVQPSFHEYGLELRDLRIENISLPPEVERAIDERSKLGALGDLAAFTQMKTAEAMLEAAQSSGESGAGSGMGLGLGFGLGQRMMQGDAGAAPPPLPVREGRWWFARENQASGPHDEVSLRAFVTQGALRAETLVWTRGMPQWAPASSVGELAALLYSDSGLVPPPLPPRA